MTARQFEPDWYARVMKGTSAVVLACGPNGSGVKLWTRRRLLGHRDDEVLADNAMSALHIERPKLSPGDDPVIKALEVKNAAVRQRLDEIKKFAAGSPVIMNWTTRDMGTEPAKFNVDALGLPSVLLDGADVILYVVRDGRITGDIDKCWVLKDAYSVEPRRRA